MKINRSIGLKAFAVAGATGLLIFGFQNCGKAGFDEALDQVAMGEVDQASAAAPFAYDATFDQISYNSCAGKELTAEKGFYTVKAGAYSQGGVSVRPAFLDYAKKQLKPIYPATEISVEQIKQFVAGTPENAEAQLQMSFRYEGAPQSVFVGIDRAPIMGIDITNILTDLTDDRMMEPIFRTQGASINYFPLGMNAGQRVFESKLTYNENDTMAEFVRSKLHNEANLSLTYSAFRDTPGLARQPANGGSQNLAFGRAYSLKFGPSGQHPGNPYNLLEQIHELNLENPAVAPNAVWQCPADLKFIIVRAQDAYTNAVRLGACDPDAFQDMLDPEYRRKLEIVRRHLRPDQWDVSIHRRCAVPKFGSCYKSSSGLEEEVEYNLGVACFQAVGQYSEPPAGQKRPQNRCAQFISFCSRQ